MHIEGSYTFQAPRQAVWDAIMDPAVMGAALPGGEKLEKVSDTEYEGVMNVRVGPVQGKFEGKIELADLIPPRSYRMKVSGQGAPGFVSGEGTLRLEPVAEGTLLRYAGDVQIGGKIAGVSQRLVESTAKSLTRQGLQTLDRQIAARLQPAAAAASAGAERAPEPVAAGTPLAAGPATFSAPAAAGPSLAGVAATTAKDVARDLAADYVPLHQQEKVFWALVGAGAMLLFVVLVRLVQKR